MEKFQFKLRPLHFKSEPLERRCIPLLLLAAECVKKVAKLMQPTANSHSHDSHDLHPPSETYLILPERYTTAACFSRKWIHPYFNFVVQTTREEFHTHQRNMQPSNHADMSNYATWQKSSHFHSSMFVSGCWYNRLTTSNNLSFMCDNVNFLHGVFILTSHTRNTCVL